MNHDDAIEMFLDDLAARLRGDGVRNRRILREVEEHLLDDAEGLIDSGVEGDMARRMAVERFGTPSEIALDFDSGLGGPIQFPVSIPVSGDEDRQKPRKALPQSRRSFVTWRTSLRNRA